MESLDFKESLKAVISEIETPISSNVAKLLLKDLGLFPLPENVQAFISEDRKFLNIKLKDSPDKKYLTFNFPFKQMDLSALRSSDDYQELIDRYQLYTNAYIDEIKEYALQESEYLKGKYPTLICPIKLRVKSFHSYVNKLNSNILSGKSPYINDIIAERIILSQYDGSQDEDLLTYMCDEVAKTLYDFRINTNFRMKKVLDPNKANSDKEYLTRDYFSFPKPNGYQSSHIQMQNIYNPDLNYETQLRTFAIEEASKTSGELAHWSYKPRPLNDQSPIMVPLYLEIPCILGNEGPQKIHNLSFEDRFYHYFNSDTSDHSNLTEKLNPITYKKFRTEQHGLEELLGVEFKEIRHRIKSLNKDNQLDR